jgi:hypothetical protein
MSDSDLHSVRESTWTKESSKIDCRVTTLGPFGFNADPYYFSYMHAERKDPDQAVSETGNATIFK